MTRPRRVTWADQLPLKRMPGDGWRLPRSSSETSWINLDAKNDEDMGSSSMKGGAAIDEDLETNLTEELPLDRVLPNPDAKRQPSPKKEAGGTEIPMTPPPKSTDAVGGSKMLQKAAPRRPKLKKSRSVTRMWNAMKRKFVKKNKPFKDKTIQHA